MKIWDSSLLIVRTDFRLNQSKRPQANARGLFRSSCERRPNSERSERVSSCLDTIRNNVTAKNRVFEHGSGYGIERFLGVQKT